MTFLPKGYEQPKEYGNYMKFVKGSNRFRVLSSAITGFEYWTKDSKPVRSNEPFSETPTDAKVDEETGKFQKHFWAFVVYNYDAKKPQILEITQKTIMQFMGSYVDNAKWGDPKCYDFVITAEGDGLEREYTVIAEPHTKAPEVDVSNIHLEALFSGVDPFAAQEDAKVEEPNEDIPF